MLCVCWGVWARKGGAKIVMLGLFEFEFALQNFPQKVPESMDW